MTSPLVSEDLIAIGTAGYRDAKEFLACDKQKEFVERMTDGLDAEQKRVYLMNLIAAVKHRPKTLIDCARGYRSTQFNAAQRKKMNQEYATLTDQKITSSMDILKAAGAKMPFEK